MLAILLVVLAQAQLTTDAYFVVGDPVIESGYVYFQASAEAATYKETNELGTLYTYAHSDPEFTFAESGVTEVLTLPASCDSMIISGAISRDKRAVDNAWLIAVGDKEGYTYVWRVQTATPEYMGAILIPNPHKITTLEFSYQGTKVLIGSEFGRVFRYDLPGDPWTLEFVNEGWHPRDDGYTTLYPIRVRLNGDVTERNLAIRYGAGKFLQFTSLGTGPDYYALIVHGTAFPETTGVTSRDADLWVLTKGIVTVPDGSEVTFIDLQGTTDYTAYKRPAPTPQKTQPLVFTMDTPYSAGTLGRTPMTCISVNDIDYYKLNLNDVYTAVPTGANFFYKETLEPGIIRYWGAYRTEHLTSTYNPPNQTYKYLRTQITPDACDGVTYSIYNFRSVVTGTTLETEPPGWADDTIDYERCDGVCPDFVYLAENDFIASGTGWKKFAVEKWVKGAYYLTDITYGYNQWIFKQTGQAEVYNDLYLVDNYQTQCTAIPGLNCTGAVIVDINLLNETNPYEEIMYAAFTAQACNPFCLELRTDYTDKPILNLTATETDFVNVEQELMRGLLGFNENRWSEEFSITSGNKRAGSLVWKYGTWTTEWPTGKGFDVAWYRISLDDPNYVIEPTTTPLTETVRQPGQIGPFTRIQYYKTSDGFYSIINDGAGDPIISVPGTVDIYDVITKEKPFVVFKSEVGNTSALIGTYVPDLVATLVHYDGVYTYFLSETVPNCTTFDLNGSPYDCTFLSGDDLRFFEYSGTLPPGIFPDCLTGQSCIDTSTAVVNLFESPTLGNGYFLFAPNTTTQDHCGITGPGLRSNYDDLIYILITSYTAGQLTAANNNLGNEVPEVADTAILCGAYPVGTALLMFFLVNGTPTDADFVLDGETFSYTGYSTGLAADVYPTVHTDLAPEICIADDCFSGGTDCISIPATSRVSVIPESFTSSQTWDDGYAWVLTAPGILNISPDHCFTGGIAYPGRSTSGKYIAQQTYADNTAAQTAWVAVSAILDSGVGNDVAYTGGNALVVNAVRVENRVYVWMLCGGTMPGISTVITFAGYPFTNSVYSPNDFSCWTWAAETVSYYTICKSSSTQVYKLDQTAQEYEGELVSSKTDLLGYEDVVGSKTYTYTDETVIDIPWSGKFYDMMYLGPDPDYEILTSVADPHYVVPQFIQEGEQIYEEEVDAEYVFAKISEGEGEPLHYEGEDVYAGAYGYLAGTPAELWVMEGEATEGEICAVPECSEVGADCQPWPTTFFLFPNCISVPGSSPLTENHCGLGPIFPKKTKEYLIYTVAGGAEQYGTYVGFLGQIRSEYFLAWVEVDGANLLLGFVYTGTNLGLKSGGIIYIPNTSLNVTDMKFDFANRFKVFTYDFGNVELDQLCVLGPYPTRGTIPGSVESIGDVVYWSGHLGTYVLTSTIAYNPRFSGIGSTEKDPEFYPPGTTWYKGIFANAASYYEYFKRLLGHNYASVSGEYLIYSYLEVDGDDLALYFLNYEDTAVPATNFYENSLPLTVPFADLSLTEIALPVCETYLLPDAIITQTNYGTGTIDLIDEDPTTPTADYIERDNVAASAVLTLSFEDLTPGCSLTGTQTFQVYIFKTGTNNDSTLTVRLYEGATLISTLVNAVNYPDAGTLVTATWSGALISNPNNVRVQLTSTRPAANKLLHIDAVRWIPTTLAEEPTDLYAYGYTRDHAPEYLAEAEQAGSVYAQTYLSSGKGYIFSTDKGLSYTVGLNGNAFPDHEKVYIDYVYTSAKVTDLRTLTATPDLGWNQVSAPIDHILAGYDIIGTVLRVYFLVSPLDTCLSNTPINLGGTFEAKTAADRVEAVFYMYLYCSFMGGNPTAIWNKIPYPDEYYGWDCIDLTDAFHYPSYTGSTWIVTSDSPLDLSSPYQTPIFLDKIAATTGFLAYSRVYGPYPKIEYEARYFALVSALGTNLRSPMEPAVLTHVRRYGNALEVFYLIKGGTVVDAYNLGDYTFSMSMLERNDNFDLVAYDYPIKLDKVCRGFYSEKIECTENFTASGGLTSSTVDLRGYTGLSEVDFGTTSKTLYHNLIKTNSPAQHLTFQALLYSVPTALSAAILTDNTFRIESAVSSFYYKDLNMFGTWLNTPIYAVSDTGAVTEPRLDNFVLFLADPLPAAVASTFANAVGKPIILNGTEYGVLTHFTDGVAYETIGVGIYETWTSIPTDLTVSLVEEPTITASEWATPGLVILLLANYKFFSFETATEVPLGKDVITAVGATTLTASVFYKETSTKYWASAYTGTALPVSAATITVTGLGSVALTSYAADQPTNNNFRVSGGSIVAISKRYDTPITLTYDVLEMDLLNPPTFSKIINLVSYTDPIPFVGTTLNLGPSVPTLGYAISVDSPTYLRFDPRLQTVSAADSGEVLTEGDIYVSATEVSVTDVMYVNFGVTEDVSEAAAGFRSIYIGDDVHSLTSVRGRALPITYADEGYCNAGAVYDGTPASQAVCEAVWTAQPFDKAELYEHTYKQDDYAVYLKDGTLYSVPSTQYTPTPQEWVTSEPEAFDIAMEWISATEPVKEFFRVYLGKVVCAGGEWEDPLDIPEECENVMLGLDVPALLEAFNEAYESNVLIDEYVIAEGVQKFWIIEDASHLGLDSFMTEEEFAVISDDSEIAKQIWYDQTKPVGYDYYTEEGNNEFYNAIRIAAYMGPIRSIVPKNVALACLRQQIRDWQFPNKERLSDEGDMRSTFIDNFILGTTNTSYNWGLINMTEPIAFQAPRVVYLTGGGQVYVNNVWGTMPKHRLDIEPHVGEYLIEVIRTDSNTLVLLSEDSIYYGKAVSDQPLSALGTKASFGVVDIDAKASASNNVYTKGNILDPWISALYRYTVPSIEGTVYLWPREFMSTEGRPWDDPPGYLIVCEP